MNELAQIIASIPSKMGNAAATFKGPSESIKTLILGCMGAGKSSFLRQMCRLYPPKNYFKHRRQQYYIYCLQLNLLNIYRELKNVCKQLDIAWESSAADFDVIDIYRHRELFTSQVVTAILNLRNSGLFEACRQKQRILQLPQNYNYFIQRAERFMSEKYVPTDHDIMMAYSQTCGHNSETICCHGLKLEFLEMPGHHIWRQRWDQFFDGANLVIFVIDLSELCDPAFYDKGYLENKTVSVFTQLTNHELLKSVFWLLLFNKLDTFNDHAAGFDFKKLANHLDTADSAKSFYRSQFTTVVPKEKHFAHMVSLVNNRDSQTTISDMFRKVSRLHRERGNVLQ